MASKSPRLPAPVERKPKYSWSSIKDEVKAAPAAPSKQEKEPKLEMVQYLMRMLAYPLGTTSGKYIQNPAHPKMPEVDKAQFNGKGEALWERLGGNRPEWMPSYGPNWPKPCEFNKPLPKCIWLAFKYMEPGDYPRDSEAICFATAYMIEMLELYHGKPREELLGAELRKLQKGVSPDISHIQFDDVIESIHTTSDDAARRALVMTCFMRVFGPYPFAVFGSCGVVSMGALIEKLAWFGKNVLAVRYPDKYSDAWMIDDREHMEKGAALPSTCPKAAAASPRLVRALALAAS